MIERGPRDGDILIDRGLALAAELQRQSIFQHFGLDPQEAGDRAQLELLPADDVALFQ